MALKPGIGVPGDEYGKPKKKKKRPLPPKQVVPREIQERYNPYKNALAPKPKPKIPEIGAAVPGKRQEAAGIEKQLQDIVWPYFQKNGAFPSPDVVAQLSKTQAAKAPTTKEQWADVWNATEEAHNEDGSLAPDEFFVMKDGYVSGALDRAMGIAGKAFVRNDPNIEIREDIQLDAETVEKHLKYQRDFKYKYSPNGNILNLGSAFSIIEYKIALANRMKALHVPVKFNPHDATWDPEFEVAANRSVMGRQMGFLFWGTEAEETKSNQIVKTLMLSPWGRETLEDIASDLPDVDPRLKGKPTDWSNQDTVRAVVQALNSDPEREKQIAYEGWVFGRAIGESEAQARLSYANRFGEDRLPAEAMVAYDKGLTGIMDLVTTGYNAVGPANAEQIKEKWKVVRKTHIGGALAAIGNATADVTNTLNYPLVMLMRGIDTAALMINYADTGVDWDTWVTSLEHSGSEEEARKKWNFKHDLSMLLDAGAWAASWEDSKGMLGPVGLFMDSMSMSATGKKSTLSTDVGQIGDAALMIFVGAKYADPAVRFGARKAVRGSIGVARAVTPTVDILAAVDKGPKVLTFPQFLAKERSAAGRTVTGDLNVFSKYHDPDKPVVAGARKQSAKRQAVVKAVDEYKANPSKETFDAAKKAIIADQRGRRAGLVRQKAVDAKSDTPKSPAEIHDGIIKKKDIEIDELHRMEYSPGADVPVVQAAAKGPSFSRDWEDDVSDNYVRKAEDNAPLEVRHAIEGWYTGSSSVGAAINDPVMLQKVFEAGAPIRARLKELAGGETIHLYRGIAPVDEASPLQRSSTSLVSSWTHRKNVADSYASNGGTVTGGRVIEADIPIDDIAFAYPRGGEFTVRGWADLGLDAAKVSPEDAYTKYLDSLPKVDSNAKREAIGSMAKYALLRTKAEHIAQMDDEMIIHKFYGMEETKEIKDLARVLAKERDPKKVNEMIQAAEVKHGGILDGDSSAAIQYLRAEAFRKGTWSNSPLSKMWTPVHYGRSQQPVSASNMLYDVIAFTRMGAVKVTPEVLEVQHSLLRKMWDLDPDDRVGQQKIIDAFDTEFAKNMGPTQMAELTKFERSLRRARGLKALDDNSGSVMYYAKRDKTTGVVEEGSKVIPVGTANKLAHEAQTAQRQEDEMAALFPDKADQYKEATKLANDRVARYRDSMHVINEYTDKDGNVQVFKPGEKFGDGDAQKTDIERKRREKLLEDAEAKIDAEFASTQPFDPTQSRKNLMFKHDPRVMGWYMAGKPAQKGILADAWVLDPITTIWKETVMASMGFPLRVQIGDELIRLIPEGVMGTWRVAKQDQTYLKTHDVNGNVVPKDDVNSMWNTTVAPMLTDDTPGGIAGGTYAPEWGYVVKGDPNYWKHLANHMKARRKSPLMQALIEKGDDLDWRDPVAVKAVIDDVRKGDSDTAKAVQAFFENTHRVNPVKGKNVTTRFDSKEYNEWLDAYTDYINEMGKNEVLSNALRSGNISAKAFKEANRTQKNSPAGPGGTPPGTMLPDTQCPPVEAPNPGASVKANPLASAAKLNPYHYVFNGLPPSLVGNTFSQISTVGMLTGISKRTKATLFSHYYYTIRRDAMRRTVEGAAKEDALAKVRAAKTPEERSAAVNEGAAELRRIARMKDDDIRSHYDGIASDDDKKELFTYASDRAGKKAIAASYSQSRTVFEDLTKNVIPFGNAYRQFALYWGKQALKNPVAMSAVKENYPEFMQDPFHAMGDLGIYFKGFPFWAPTLNADSDQSFITANLPMIGPVPSTIFKMGVDALGGDIANWQNKPLLGSTAPGMAIAARQGKMISGITGATWDTDSLAGIILGDSKKLEQAHLNAELVGLEYGRVEDGGIRAKAHENHPGWYKGIEMLDEWLNQVPIAGKLVNLKPEVLAGDFLKTTIPFPTTLFYSPEKVRERENLQFDFAEASRNGDQAKMAKLRAENKWLDLRQSYLEASPEEQVMMRHDPEYAEELPWYTSMLNYDAYNRPIGAKDTIETLYANGVRNKTEAELLASVNNILVDITGGDYLSSPTRKPTSYEGDVAAQAAFDAKEKKIEKAKVWAKGVLARAKNLTPAQKTYLFDCFVNSDEMNFGWWETALRGNKDKNGKPHPLLPEEYRIDRIEYVYQKYHEEKMMDEGYPGPTMTNLERGNEIAAMQPGTAGDRWLTSVPASDRLTKTLQDKRDKVLKELTYRSGDQWYYMGSEKMELLGVKYTPTQKAKWDNTQLELNAEYTKLKENYTTGSKEYRAARNAYWKLVDRKLKGQPGGDMITGGLGDRMRATKVFTEPDLVSVGTGPNGPSEAEAWREYVHTEAMEYSKAMPNMKTIDAAWRKVAIPNAKNAAEMTPLQRRRMEVGRAAYWKYLLIAAKAVKEDLKHSYSEYYKGPGNSAASNYGKKKVAGIDKMIKAMAKDNPLFKADLDKYFDKDVNLAGRLCDWYRYL